MSRRRSKGVARRSSVGPGAKHQVNRPLLSRGRLKREKEEATQCSEEEATCSVRVCACVRVCSCLEVYSGIYQHLSAHDDDISHLYTLSEFTRFGSLD